MQHNCIVLEPGPLFWLICAAHGPDLKKKQKKQNATSERLAGAVPPTGWHLPGLCDDDLLRRAHAHTKALFTCRLSVV